MNNSSLGITATEKILKKQTVSLFSPLTSVDKATPILSMPTSTRYPLGGHAVTALGYDLTKQLVLIKNSFGNEWGDNGYGWISFEYINQEAFEKWCFDR